jgi:hypothetical protein
VKTGNQLIELSKTEKVPNVIVLLLQTVNDFRANCNDKSLAASAKELFHSFESHQDSDVSYSAQSFSSK